MLEKLMCMKHKRKSLVTGILTAITALMFTVFAYASDQCTTVKIINASSPQATLKLKYIQLCPGSSQPQWVDNQTLIVKLVTDTTYYIYAPNVERGFIFLALGTSQIIACSTDGNTGLGCNFETSASLSQEGVTEK
jgi:hypothetical protein